MPNFSNHLQLTFQKFSRIWKGFQHLKKQIANISNFQYISTYIRKSVINNTVMINQSQETKELIKDLRQLNHSL